jgi:Flp pilus assembly protein CpaB
MKHNVLFIAVLILFDGVAIAWAAWEFWSIRKSKAETAEASDASKEAPGHSEGEHRPNDG